MFSYWFVCAFMLHPLIGARAALPELLLSPDTSESNPFDCLTNSLDSASSSLYCRGSRAIQNVIHNLSKSNKPIVIVRGLEIVPSKDESVGGSNNSTSSASTSTSAEPEDDTFLGSFSAYLRSHELNIKFSDLLADESERYAAVAVAARDLEQNGDKIYLGSGAEEARKKDKGQGIILTIALMFAKILAVMGLSGIGALAIKALGVGMTALLLSGMIGLKTLSQHGHENSHSVQYVSADGHHHVPRRRRSVLKRTEKQEFNPLPLVYWGWQKDIKRAVAADVKDAVKVDVKGDAKVQNTL